MRFSPKSEQDVNDLLKPGICDFTVISAKEKPSKAGNDMIHITMEVFDADGKKAIVYDYLMEAMAKKLRHFSLATRLDNGYEAGELSAYECEGRSGKLKIRTSVDEGGRFPEKNEVVDYIVDNSVGRSSPATKPIAQSAPVVSLAKGNAWKTFCARTSQLDGSARKTAADVAVKQLYGPDASSATLTDRQWEKFSASLSKWTIADGFPEAMRFKSDPSAEVLAGPGIEEDDIPFDLALAA